MCVCGGVVECRCVLELERQDKVCMYTENEAGLGGNLWIEEPANFVFSMEKKPSNIQNQNKQTFKWGALCEIPKFLKTFSPTYFLNIIRWAGELC